MVFPPVWQDLIKGIKAVLYIYCILIWTERGISVLKWVENLVLWEPEKEQTKRNIGLVKLNLVNKISDNKNSNNKNNNKNNNSKISNDNNIIITTSKMRKLKSRAVKCFVIIRLIHTVHASAGIR